MDDVSRISRMGVQDKLASLVGQAVVLDTEGHYVFLGQLSEINEHYLILKNADVHDLRDTNSTREVYVLESRLHGIRANRHRVLVRRDQVISVSLLSDVVE